MATWTQKLLLTNSISSFNYGQAFIDGTDRIYYVGSNTEVKYYDTTLNSITTIGNSGSFGGAKVGGSPGGQRITVFKSGVYLISDGTGGGPMTGWQWDGTGTAWTNRFTITAGDERGL